MICVNTSEIAGYKITESLRLVTGNVVQSKHIGRDIMAGLKTIIGGEITGYTALLSEARFDAQKRMEMEAQKIDADAIINIRYTTSAISQGMSELLAYGTAVKIEKL